MDTKEWDELCSRVNRDMTEYVQRFAAPLTMSEEHGSGLAWGSGTYIKGPSGTWILTAEHVIAGVPDGGRLAHLPRDGGDYNAAFGTPEVAPWPVDAAALPIYPAPEFLPLPERVLDPALIAQSYDPVDEEVLFMYGFPGYHLERNDPRLKDKLIVSRFGHLTVRGKPLLTQAIKPGASINASNFDPIRHVAVHYPSIGTSVSTGMQAPLPNPAGMSGCALWDTKFVKCDIEGIPWSPHMAEVCGVVWAVHDNPEVVFVTRIEHVRAALPDVF